MKHIISFVTERKFTNVICFYLESSVYKRATGAKALQSRARIFKEVRGYNVLGLSYELSIITGYEGL